MAEHAILSASASERWLKCPPSARLCAQEEDEGSPYARQGTDAHELCRYLLEKALGRDSHDPTENLTWYNAEMQEAAEGYVAFVMEQIAEAEKICPDPLICVEQKLDFSRWVEQGFGTGDCIIVADDLLHIVDFKFGVGVLVSASGDDNTGNSQMKCYALGALDAFGDLYDIRRVRLSIYQPRRENTDTFELTREQLLDWAENTLAPIARLAFAGEGDFHAGDHCAFCRVRAVCRERVRYNMTLAACDYADPSTLDTAEIAAILPRIHSLVSWAEDIKTFALEQALSGTKFPGFKVVEGKSNRIYRDEAEVARVVSEAGYEPYEKRLLGITAMTRQLGKKRFDELLHGLVVKPAGKPVLVPETDERPEFRSATIDFDEGE